MPFIVTGLISAGVALLRGGRLTNLTGFSIRWPALPLLALGLQILVLYGPGRHDADPFSVSAWLILGSYALLMVAVWANRRLPGMLWLGLGAALNFLVILINGGWMPVMAQSLVSAGFIDTPSAIDLGQRVWATKDVVMTGQRTHLLWLSDVLVIPKAGIFSAVFSVGDVLMILGLFRLIQAGMLDRAGQAP